MFDDFRLVSVDNMIFVYGKWVGNTPQLSRKYLEVVSNLESTSKRLVCPGTDFFFSTFSTTYFLSFRRKFTFWTTNLKIHPVEYAHMDHADHFGLSFFFTLTCKPPSITSIWGKNHFFKLSGK